MKHIQAYTNIYKDHKVYETEKVIFYSGRLCPERMERVNITSENLTGRYKENTNSVGKVIMLIEIKIPENPIISRTILKKGLFGLYRTELFEEEERPDLHIWVPEDFIYFETTFKCGEQ